MKKIIILIALFNLSFASYTQDASTIKFFLKDGNIKEFFIKDIKHFLFPQQSDSMQMEILSNGNQFYYPTKVIDSIFFSVDESNQLNLVIIIGGSERKFPLNSQYNNKFYYTKFNSITIGHQVWMLKNLDVDHYRNGDPIEEVTDKDEWAAKITGAWCNYENWHKYDKVFGKLYNWYAVNDPRGLAPPGWHVASDEEWIVLREFLGGENVAGGKLKEVGTSHWRDPNNYATNETGFTAIPSSHRTHEGIWGQVGYAGVWWTSTEVDELNAWDWVILNSDGRLRRGNYNKSYGLSVRCVKDE